MRSFASCLLLLFAVSLQAAEPPKSPLSPEESLKHFVLADPNLQIEIVAAEPEVIDPVAIQFDEHGRLWVVELSDYPNGPEPGKPPMSRIKLLEDKDGDGRYETAHIFADKLLFATGVQPWDGGVIVTLAGEVAYFKDTDGDHKADLRETWFTGFAQANPQLRANHPTFGPDGWIYVANGLRGGDVIAKKKNWPSRLGLRPDPSGKEKVGTESQPTEPQPVSLTGRDFKFDPLTGRYEAISGNGQFGMTFDAWGNRFVCDNRHPCRHVIFEEDFIKRCPHVAFPAVVHDVIPADDKNRVFPLTSAWTTSNLHAGTFTAACGVTVYTGDWLPEEFRGNVFVCEPTGNLVQRAILEPDGVTFKSRNPYRRTELSGTALAAGKTGTDKPKRDSTPPAASAVPLTNGTQEFLASRDDWFRPVDLQNGPDGALYVVDMYRAVIEHPEWVPDELKKRPDTWLGNDKGRIYRIRPKSGQPTKIDLAVLRERPVSQIRSRNRWVQMTARRLMTRDGTIHSENLPGLAGEVDYGSRDIELIRTLRPLTADVQIRKEDLKDGTTIQFFPWEQLRHAEPRVRFTALQTFALISSISPIAIQSSVPDLAVADASDPWVRQACVAVGADNAALLLNQVLQRCDDRDLWKRDGVTELVSLIGEQVGARATDIDLNLSIARLCQAVRSGEAYHRNWHEFEVGLSGLLAVSHGLTRRGASFASLDGVLSESAKFGLKDVSRACGGRSIAEDAAPALRKLAIRWLRFAEFDGFYSHGAQLRQLSETLSDQSLRLVALESFASFRLPEVDAWLVERYRSETPAIRRAILAALFASKERQLRLLEAIEQGEIAATELGPVQANQLTQSKDETVRERAKTILAAAAPASRKEVLDAYQPALSLKADPKRGRELFVKNCSTCHRVDNVGVNVAPDISDTRTKKPEQLLLDILDPNKAIDANYFAYAVVTKEGKTESGVISSETATSITLKQPEGKVLTLLRTDIDELRNTGLSLMPIGVEKNIDQQAMADLIFWLKNWRYLDGKVPATSLGK